MKTLTKIKELTNGVFQDNKVFFVEEGFSFSVEKTSYVYIMSWENTKGSSNLLKNMLESKSKKGFSYDNNRYSIDFRDLGEFNEAKSSLLEIAKRT